MALLYLTPVSNGVCSFLPRGVCQYDLNEVRSFASDIRWASLCGSQRPRAFLCSKPLRAIRRLVVGGPAKLSEKGSLVCKHSNGREPSDDLSRIRGEILSSGDLVTLPRTYTCTECSYGKVHSWVWNQGGLLREILSRPLQGVRTHLRGLQVTVTRMAGK